MTAAGTPFETLERIRSISPLLVEHRLFLSMKRMIHSSLPVPASSACRLSFYFIFAKKKHQSIHNLEHQ
jgi:hypothetical protein